MVKYWALSLLVATVLLISAYRALPDDLLHVYFLDIGQGDAILIRTPDDQFVLVDGGPDDKILTELNDVMPFFRKRLDLVVLTHAHADHLNGLVSVINRYEVGAVLMPGAQALGSYYAEFIQLIEEKNIALQIAESRLDYQLGKVYLDVLHPVESILGRKIENQNNSSVVMKLVYGENSVLLTGDAEKEAEHEQLLTDFDLSADILKTGHHGSRTSSSDAYLKAVQPELAVIQCGKDNEFKHPHLETLQKLYQIPVEKIYRNDLHGRVHFAFDRYSLVAQSS